MTKFWEFHPASMLAVLPAASGCRSDPVNRGAAPVCPICGNYIGMLAWLPPYRVVLELHNKQWEDVVGLPGEEFLVSAAYVHLHMQRLFTGLAPFMPVEVVRVKYRTKFRPEPPTYFVTKVLKSNARVDDAASELIRNNPQAWCRYCGGSSEIARSRLVLEPNTWKGEDWFEPQNLSRPLVTDRVVKAIMDAGLTGWRFERCENARYRVHDE